jgi:hypothetical protein
VTEHHFQADGHNPSPLMVLAAAAALSGAGRNTVAPDGANTWTVAPEGTQRYLVAAAPASTVADRLQALMVQAPRAASPA